jgi:hypothetical protein
MICQHKYILSEPHFMLQVNRAIIRCIQTWNLQASAMECYNELHWHASKLHVSMMDRFIETWGLVPIKYSCINWSTVFFFNLLSVHKRFRSIKVVSWLVGWFCLGLFIYFLFPAVLQFSSNDPIVRSLSLTIWRLTANLVVVPHR